MNYEVIRDIGVKLHEGSKKRWVVHPMMVVNYMKAICARKMKIDNGTLEENGCLTRIQKIAYGHDLLKKIKGHQEVVIGNQTFVIDLPDEKPALMSDLVTEMLNIILHDLGFNSEEIECITKELLAVGKFHGLNSAAWLHSQGEDDPAILVPILMHQCPVPSLYGFLPPDLQELCEITLLADKCSKNILKAYVYHQPVPILLYRALFGNDGNEFNYSSTLLLARIIQQGKKPSDIQKASTKMFKKRCEDIGLPIPPKCRLEAISNNPFLASQQEVKDVKEALYKEYGEFYSTENSGTDSHGEGSQEPDGSDQSAVSSKDSIQEQTAPYPNSEN